MVSEKIAEPRGGTGEGGLAWHVFDCLLVKDKTGRQNEELLRVAVLAVGGVSLFGKSSAYPETPGGWSGKERKRKKGTVAGGGMMLVC